MTRMAHALQRLDKRFEAPSMWGKPLKVRSTEDPRTAAARAAGIALLITVVGWTLNFILVDSRIIAVGDVAKTVANLRGHEALFRLGLANELIFAICGVVLACALYRLVEQVNRNLALLALCLKLIEVAVGAALVGSAFVALQMVNGAAGRLDETGGAFLAARSTGVTVAMVFLGLDSILFYALLFVSRSVPRALSALGVLSYVLILFQSFITLLAPVGSSSQPMIDTMSLSMFAPSVVFELLAGAWLLIKGVKHSRLESEVFASPSAPLVL
jgi:hypothetical protein